jgi:hypothetical protein
VGQSQFVEHTVTDAGKQYPILQLVPIGHTVVVVH